MNMISKRFVPLIGILVLAGCAARHYHPAPIVATETASRLESRSLADAGLRSFEEKALGHQLTQWPTKSWDLQTLSAAALYFNPALDVARARVGVADTAIVTAGARPNPNLSIQPGIPSPYLLSLDFSVPIETAGKRGYRIQAARNLSEAARLDLANSAWTILIGVRLALLNQLIASQNLELLRSEEKAHVEQVNILEQIFSAGEIPRVDVDNARIELAKTQVAARNAEGQVSETREALAAAIGIPVAGLHGAEFSWPDMDKPPAAESFSFGEIQRDAVLNRLDVRRSLAEYAAAESNLQLEVARQYPDINLGPGYTYEERNNFFTVGFLTSLPLFNRNQGPIAEAEARRKQAAASFLQTQSQVIARSERALTVYAAALKALADTQSLYKLQEDQVKVVEQSIRAGAADQLSMDGAQIQLSVLARARLDAQGRAQSALGELEDAVQRPLDPGWIRPVPRLSDNTKASPLGELLSNFTR
ncbi:MAG TPA: TolC family protein [Candidatus Angelobacter sp.]|nr:TolC family protein [Candidatus Angelobacter sp.]